MLKIEIFVNPPFMENTYVIYEDGKPEAYIIDPGGSSDEIIKFIHSKNLIPKAIINTHGHIDHIYAVEEIKTHFKIPFHIHKNDEVYVTNLPKVCTMYGIPSKKPPTIDHFMSESQTYKLNEMEIKVLPSFGHTPGGVSFYLPEAKVLFSGDTLFLGSIGRTDLPGGDSGILKKTLKFLIESLPEDVVVYSGHGDKTSIGQEKRTNPFYLGQVDF